MALVKPRAILFDWDNTLVDTWPVIHKALYNTFTQMNMEPWTIETVRQRVAKSMRDSFPEVFGANWQEAAKIYQSEYQSIHLEMLKPLVGARSTLEALHDKLVFVGIVSNKRGHNLRTEVTHLGWSDYFDCLVGADDAAKDKPSPDPVLHALKDSGIVPDADVWFVGDSVIDMECAKNTGCSAVFYGNAHTPDDSGSTIEGFPLHALVEDHTVLQKLLQKWV
jgi:phosphoglycolate phosphatase